MPQITIIGTGLIGGSIGLALKQRAIDDLIIVAHDREPSVAGRAVKRGAADRRELNLHSAVKNADLIILATPALAVKETLEYIGSDLIPGTIVTDTCSTKVEILKWAHELLPRGVSFVGGHPMAGREFAGIDAADPNLFVEATYCILPATDASKDAVDTITGMVNLLGARHYFIDPAEHDSYVAAVSHLPIAISTTLINIAAKSNAWREMGQIAATGFRDVTRLASGDPTMSRDIYLTNSEAITYWIDAFIQELTDFREKIAKRDPDIENIFTQAMEYRDRWLAKRLEDNEMPVEIPTSSENIAAMFVGSRMASMMKNVDPKQQEKKQESNFFRRS
jgi:prephenate dehydrogenase